MLAKAQLAQRICEIIAERKLTQTKAASLLGIDQPKISALMRGKLDGFSADRLFRFLNALGRDVEIVIRPARHAGDAVTRVISRELGEGQIEVSWVASARDLGPPDPAPQRTRPVAAL